VIALHAAVGLADDDTLAVRTKFIPYTVGADRNDIPLRPVWRRLVAGLGFDWNRQRAQVRAVEDAVDFGLGGQVRTQQRPGVYFDAIESIVRAILDA
jgi:hypothetical protein